MQWEHRLSALLQPHLRGFPHPGPIFSLEYSLRFPWHTLKFPWKDLVWNVKIFWPPHTPYCQPGLHLPSKSSILCFFNFISIYLSINSFSEFRQYQQHISSITRPSENDNTPQPLDQWTNIPFMFQFNPLLGQCSCHALHVSQEQVHFVSNIVSNSHLFHSKVKVGITSYRIISLSFHFDQPPCSWNTAISKTDLENPRSRSWVRSKFTVTMWVLYLID